MPVPTGIVLWKVGNVTCSCLTVALNHVEITLTVDGVIALSRRFDHHAEAARCAIEMRRAKIEL